MHETNNQRSFSRPALTAVGVDTPSLPVPRGDKIKKEEFISHM